MDELGGDESRDHSLSWTRSLLHFTDYSSKSRNTEIQFSFSNNLEKKTDFG